MPSPPIRTDRNRDIHPDDRTARKEFVKQMISIRKAAGIPAGVIKQTAGLDILQREQSLNWRLSSIQAWVGYYNFTFGLTFEGFDHVEGFDPHVAGEGAELVHNAREKIVKLRKQLKISGADMDRCLGSHRSYLLWEARPVGDAQLSAIQRVVRALGGRLKINLTHKYNSGINKRIGT